MADSSITRVYQFLTEFNKKSSTGDWKTVADKNGNGVVIKSEFKDFMLSNFKDWNGEESKDDLINEFWKSIDTKTAGKVNGTKLRNKNALDTTELDTMDKKIRIYEIMNDFVKKNVNTADAGVNDKTQWLKSVKQSLGTHLDVYINNGGTEEGTEEFLAGVLANAKAMATANLYAQEYLRSAEIKDMLPEGYTGQGTMQDIISKFVTSLSEDSSFQALSTDSEKIEFIKNKAQEIVKAYLATADIGSGNPSILEQYGYYAEGDMNDVQKAVLTKSMGESINTHIASNSNIVDTESNKEKVQEAVNNYINKKLDSASYDDFKTLKNFDSSEIENDEDLKALIAELEKEFAELELAKKDLKDYCSGLANKHLEYVDDAIKKVFGSADYASKIDPLKTIEEVNDLKEAIEAEMDAISKQVNLSSFSDITVSMKTGESKFLDLPTTLTTITGEMVPTNEIEYKIASGSTHLEKSGFNVTANGGSDKGTYVETIEIYAFGILQGTKTVTMNISLDGSKFAVDNSQIDYSKVDSRYASNGQIHERGKGWSGSKDAAYNAGKSILNNDRLKSQIKAQITNKGLSDAQYTKLINSIFDTVYSQSIDETLNSDNLITGRGARGLSSQGHAYINVKTMCDLFIEKFNTNLATAVENLQK